MICLKNIIDTGLNAEVYLAEDATGEIFAAKKFKARSSHFDKEIAAADAIGKHPNIVEFRGAILSLRILLFELCDRDLAEHYNNKFPINPRNLLADISAALAHIHSRNIVHADLHFGNILVDENTYKLADFGNHIILINGEYSYPAQYHEYFPPEVYCEYRYTLKSDVWTFGYLFFEMYWPKKTRPKLRADVLREMNSGKHKICDDPAANNLINLMVKYNDTERPTAADICRQLKK